MGHFRMSRGGVLRQAGTRAGQKECGWTLLQGVTGRPARRGPAPPSPPLLGEARAVPQAREARRFGFIARPGVGGAIIPLAGGNLPPGF